ncbi:hypothetical protein SCUCBS95973_001429 [Sporothrix curviconia]|uniref:Myb-like domain-containing protein n=1 Tax=Sporothrix curviconia TaxID=1260050 RepID=A0ABP0AYJ4_9PEZI
MSRRSRSSSANSESYTTSFEALHPPHHSHGHSMPSYYHHGRVGSLSGADTNGYYDQIPDTVSSPAALGSNAMAAVAYQQHQQHQHQHQQTQQDPFAVGPPLTLGSSTMPAAVVASSGRLRQPARSGSKSSTKMVPAGSARGHPNNYSVQPVSAVQPVSSVSPVSSASAASTVAAAAAPSILPAPRVSSSGAWRPQDDDMLLLARSRGENWAQIQLQFPGKTPNACRKRHERLVERRNAGNDFDARKMEQIARGYMQMRRDMWQPLANRTGEKWTVVEAKCMEAGVKNLMGMSRSSTRRLRIESVYNGGGGGVGGGTSASEYAGMPVGGVHVGVGSGVVGGGGYGEDALGSDGLGHDFEAHGGDDSSPGGSRSVVSAGSNSSGVPVQTASHHQTHHHQHSLHQHRHSLSASAARHHHGHTPQDVGGGAGAGSPGTYPDYYTTTAGFSESLRALDGATAAAAAAISVAVNVNGTGNGSSSAAMVSPYMAHHHGHHGHPGTPQHGQR